MAVLDLGLPKSLSTLVSNKFNAAEKAGNIIFSASEVALIQTRKAVSLQCRYCPSLAKKPKANESKDETKKKVNPFENPSEDVLVTSIPTATPSHRIVLNKFPIIKNHFILSTIPWKSQTDLLEQDDLAVSHALIRAWPGSNSDQSLFAFFNSGSQSGASQPHRHVQFLPVADMLTPESAEWRPAIEHMAETCREKTEYTVQACSAFPFAHFACRIPPDPEPNKLHEAYLSLYAAAVESIPPPSSEEFSVTNNAPEPPEESISYNLAMLKDVMAIVPRKSEFAPLSSGGGEVGFNGTVLAGTFMLKDEGTWKKLSETPEEMEGVLEGIGYPFPSPPEEDPEIIEQKL